MTGNSKRQRHPGQVDRRDTRKARLKTDPDRTKWETQLKHRR